MPPAPTTPTSADLAEELAAGGAADAVIRLGWEFNGSWCPWAAQHDTRDFVAYWRHVPDTMRGVEGTDFRFARDVVLGTTQFPVQTTYPEGDYVDVITASLYDQSWSARTAGAGVALLTQTLDSAGWSRSPTPRASLSASRSGDSATVVTARYKLFRGRSSGGPFDHFAGSTTGLMFRDRNLAPNRTYHYLVKSVDGAGNWSECPPEWWI